MPIRYTIADIKSIVHQHSNDSIEFAPNMPASSTSSSGSNSSNSLSGPEINSNGLGFGIRTQKANTNPLMQATTTTSTMTMTAGIFHARTKKLENFTMYENFRVPEAHRIEDGICTQLTRLPSKKQDLFKQYGIYNNHSVSYYEKLQIIENFNRFCNVSVLIWCWNDFI